MLHMAAIYQDPKASNRLLGSTGDGDKFIYDWPKKQFTWTSKPLDTNDYEVVSLKIALKKLTKDLVTGYAVLSTEEPYMLTYVVHPVEPF